MLDVGGEEGSGGARERRRRRTVGCFFNLLSTSALLEGLDVGVKKLILGSDVSFIDSQLFLFRVVAPFLTTRFDASSLSSSSPPSCSSN